MCVRQASVRAVAMMIAWVPKDASCPAVGIDQITLQTRRVLAHTGHKAALRR
jgi:ribulose 1,5-bisphosphate synthetase/thiazole synthase